MGIEISGMFGEREALFVAIEKIMREAYEY